jgi:hypothetical protein
MFFDFCPAVEYPEELWPLIWDLEVAAQSVFLANIPETPDKSREELRAEMIKLRRFYDPGFKGSVYLDSILDGALKYIRANKHLPDDERVPAELRPNETFIRYFKA